MSANLLLLGTKLAALQAMQILWSKEHLKIAIDLICIDIGLHNYNFMIRLRNVVCYHTKETRRSKVAGYEKCSYRGVL